MNDRPTTDKPLIGPSNPIEPGRDRIYICGRELRCTYCFKPFAGFPLTRYDGEEHEAGCPVGEWIEAQLNAAQPQQSLFD